MKSDTIRRYKNLVFVLIVFSVMLPFFSLLSNAAEADGWYWSDDDKILYVKDGEITKRQLYKAIAELHGSTPKAVKYNPQKAPSGWDYGGTTLTSASTAKEELSNGTYVAACRTKDTFAKGREEYEFTVIVYYDLSISVTSGAPDGAGASLSATKVLSGESVMITVNEVAGYKAEIMDMSGAPISDTNAYKPSASGELTVTYSILPKYDVTVNTANSEYGTVTLKSESEGVSGAKVLYEIKPLEKTATVDYFIESVSAGGVPLVQDENGYYVYTVGDGDAVVEVSFGKRELLCNSDPTATVHSGMSFEEIQKALFNAVIADSLRAEITENKISFFYYPRKKAAGNLSEESPIAINTPAGADEYSFAEGSGPYITERIRIEWDGLYYETNIVLFDPRPIAGINASDMKFEGKTAPADIMAKILSRLSATLTDPSNSASTSIILSEENLSWDKPFAWPDPGESAVFTVTVNLDGEYAGQNSKSFTLTCQNTTPSYRITFRSENKIYYEYFAFEGDPLVLPSDPERENYEFAGWDPAVSGIVTDIATYKATWIPETDKNGNGIADQEESFTVYWDLDCDGKADDHAVVKYGEMPAYSGAEPKKTDPSGEYSFTFVGWDKNIEAVTENITYTAVFSSSKKSYTVTWINGDTLLKTETLEYGSMPSYDGETPTKIDPNGKYTYTFSGWSPEIKAVTGNITYSAQFKSNVNQYTVTWKNYDGAILKTEKIDHGTVPYYTGATPDKVKDAQYTYTFNGWDTIPTEVTSDIEFIAQFRKTVNKYTVYWDYDGDGKAEDSFVLEYGVLPSHFAPNKNSDTQYDYTFLGWSPEIKHVSENITYTAVFGENVRKYTVSWINGNTVLKTETLEYGSVPSYDGETPTKIDPNGKYTYTFSGWSPEIKAVIGDITYSAQFKSNVKQYTVTWKNYDGTVLKTEKVDHGTVPYYTGATPVKVKDAQYTYTFNGWNVVPSEVTSDVEYTAQFRKTVNKYTVYWDYDGDGKAEDSFVLEYGVLPSHFAPNKTSDTQYDYTFLGWSPEIKPVSENITYTAVFGEKVRNYTVSWTDGSKVLLSKTYEYGEMPVYDAAVPVKDIDAKYTYSFAGWSPEISPVRGNIVYTAVFSKTLNADSGRIFIDGGAEEFDTKKLIGLKNKVVSASGLPLPGNYSVLMVVDDLFGETEHINIETGIEFDALILACRLTVGKALDFIIADNDEGISVRVTMYIADARPTVSISLKEQEITIGGKSSPDDIVGYLSAYITAMASDPASGNSLPIPISDKNIDWCPDLVWPSAGQTLKYTVKISINDKEYAKPAYSEISVILNNTTPFYTVSYYDGLGGLLAKYRVAEGESAPTPEDPSRSHHSFNGWDTDPPSAVMSDSSHIAVWKLLPHEFSLKKAYEIYLAQPATCSSPALYYMSCECGLAGSETFSFGEKDPSLHASAEFFYTDNKDGVTHLRSRACCSSLSNAQEAHFFDTDADMICLCGYDRTHRHGTGSFVSGHAPSCVSELSGRHYYYICSCGDKFYDEDCTDPVINDTDLIIPYRHSTVYHAAVEANCCSFGSAEHFECSICQRLFADSNAFTELFDITIRPSGDHRSAKTENDAEYHWYICEAGGTVFGKDEHIPNIPYVTEKEAKYCTVCECLLEEKLEHIHRGGQATCLSPAVCEGCGDGYGMLADHDFSSDGICIYCGKEKEGSAPIVTEEITTEAETEADTTAPQTTVPEVTENETSPDTDITEENAPTGDLCPIWMLYALIILFVAIFAFTVKKKRTR